MFLDSLSYPLRDNAWIMLIIGGFILTAQNVAAGFFGVAGLVVALGITAYFGAYYLQIVDRTITGSDDAPDWPDISGGLADLLEPALRIIALLLISFGPHVAIASLMEGGTQLYRILDIATLVWGVVYFPMSVVCAQNFGTLSMALPNTVIPAMFRLMPGYLAVVGLLAFMVIIGRSATAFAAEVVIIGPFAAGAVWLYFITFHARLIGMLCRTNLDRLGWDEDEPAAPGPAAPPAAG